MGRRLLPAALSLMALAAMMPMHAAGAASPGVPLTIHLAGDSTMAEKLPQKRPETGWGEHLAAQFAPGAIKIDNHAKNGRSTRRFIEEGLWDALLQSTHPGDVVLIQFGHNDASENKPDRYTPPAAFARNLARFVADVRARDAVPVLLTPVARRQFGEAGQLQATHGIYPDLVREVAAREKVVLVDMERRSSALLQEVGVEPSKQLFLWVARGANPNYPDGVEDNTHFSPEGARRVAREFAQALCGVALPLKERLRQPCE